MGSSQSTPAATPVCAEKHTTFRPASQSLDAIDQVAKNLEFNLNLDVISPRDLSGAVSLADVKGWESNVSTDSKIALSRNILSKSDPKDTLLLPTAKVVDAHVFNTSLDFNTGPITNQMSSGRCWMFATTNVLRYHIMKKLGIKEFQLSQSYFFFYDKLEKANFYLENSIELAEEPLDSRLVSFLNQSPIGDGGQWDMAVNIVEKYGVVPQAVFPESFSSSNSRSMDALLTTKLREYALLLRKQYNHFQKSLDAQGPVDKSIRDVVVRQALEKAKQEYMQEVWTILSITLGLPPKPDDKFTWDYYDDKERAKTFIGTPLEFYSLFASKPYPVSDYFSVVNDPRNKYTALYSVDRLGNVWGGRPVLYVNAEIGRLKDAVIKAIKAGLPVFFGADVSSSTDSPLGIMDTGLHDFENAFNISFGLTKAERMQLGESAMNHAMVITAVHLAEDGTPVRYKVENSWGSDKGNKGFFVMTDRWFDALVYQVVIPKALAAPDLVKVFEEGKIEFRHPAWDNLGKLA